MVKQVSIIIPCYNEEDNISKLVKEIHTNVIDTKLEVIIINDASLDNTIKKVNNLSKDYSFLKIINNTKQLGQSYSIIKGVKIASFENIITLDGDGQNDPVDIPIMINEYFNRNIDLLAGIRKNRKDSFIKILSSKFANFIRSYILNDDCEDTGCSLKIFKKNIFLSLPEFDSIHRYIPALFKAKKAKINFIVVRHRNREYGKSNYGTIDRLIKGIIDLIKVLKIIKLLKN